MGKTLKVVKKTDIDTRHKEGEPQKTIAKEVCSQSTVSKHINGKFSGRKNVL